MIETMRYLNKFQTAADRLELMTVVNLYDDERKKTKPRMTWMTMIMGWATTLTRWKELM